MPRVPPGSGSPTHGEAVGFAHGHGEALGFAHEHREAVRFAHKHRDAVGFAHESERQFARLLDFYGVAWEYEPTEFTLEWDAEGRAARAFRPDFYLPGYDRYIEITTLNQRLVTKKNRKVRRLRELHPEVQVQILYQRDYLNLLVKFGLEDGLTLSEIDGLGHAPPVTRQAAAVPVEVTA